MTSSYFADGKKIIIVLSEFNQPVTENLYNGAVAAFSHFGGRDPDLRTYRVPGAFEIPGTIHQILKHHKPDAVVAIGAVIRGETPHFEFVAGESARGLAEISKTADIPIINGIITTDSARQAYDRSEEGGRNKGWEALEAALQTISVYGDIQTAS